jgi:hypothetical protein
MRPNRRSAVVPVRPDLAQHAGPQLEQELELVAESIRFE